MQTTHGGKESLGQTKCSGCQGPASYTSSKCPDPALQVQAVRLQFHDACYQGICQMPQVSKIYEAMEIEHHPQSLLLPQYLNKQIMKFAELAVGSFSPKPTARPKTLRDDFPTQPQSSQNSQHQFLTGPHPHNSSFSVHILQLVAFSGGRAAGARRPHYQSSYFKLLTIYNNTS